MGRLGYILQWVFSWDTYAFLWLWRIILLLLVGGAEIFRKKRITHIAIFMVRPPPYSAFVFPSFWVSTTLLKYFHVVGCLRFFSTNSLHNFPNEFVVPFLPERILLIYFFRFWDNMLVLIIWVCIHHMVCNIGDPEMSWNEKYLLQLTFVLACLVKFASSFRGYDLDHIWIKDANQPPMDMDTMLAARSRII